MRISAVLNSLVFTLLLVVHTFAFGAPFDAVQISPSATPVGVGAMATVTATITDPTVIGASVNLQKLDPQGRATVVGNLRDDGTQGDAAANDQIYTIQFTIYEETPGTLRYRVSAAVQGRVTRVFSDLLSL